MAVEDRRDEVREAVLVRVSAIHAPRHPPDANYLAGVRQAVDTAVDHTIDAGRGVDRDLPIPEPILAQARLAARRRTPLETVLRRYLAGHAILGDFVAEEAGRQATPSTVLRGVLRSQAAETDRVLAVISRAYREESDATRVRTAASRRTDQVRRLLMGELVDPVGLDYPLDRWHVGVVLRGQDNEQLVKSIALHIDASLLLVNGDEDLVWGWVGAREKPDPDRIIAALGDAGSASFSGGVGEPGLGRAGWRVTHDQAKAAIEVALRSDLMFARYSEVALVASAMQDDLLCRSLRALYLDPLEAAGEEGEDLRRTLKAYLAVNRNVTSAAATLGVSRNTVTNRLRRLEARVGHLSTVRTEHLALALRLSELS